MKHYLSTFAGSAICGGFAFGIWPELWKLRFNGRMAGCYPYYRDHVVHEPL